MRLAVNQFPPNVQSADLASAWRGFAMDMSSDGSATIWANNSSGASTTSNTKGLMYGYDHTAYWNTLTSAQQENIIPSMKMVKSLVSAAGAYLPLAGGTMTGRLWLRLTERKFCQEILPTPHRIYLFWKILILEH
jgi:hypothetical protein